MAPLDIVLSASQTLLAAIDSPLFKDISFIFGYKSELLNLKNTVSTASAVLLDAQSKQDHELSHQAHDYIEKLKYAVYDADDLLDKFATLAAQKQQLEGGKFSKEVRAFFSRLNQPWVAYTMSRGIKDIRKTLDAITGDRAQFGIGLGSTQPMRRRNKETCSYVYEQSIIGREGDKKVVIDMLSNPNVEANVSFVTIVGIGGLGKTAFAQLVYNDKVIESVFPLRMWVCISDQDPKHLDMAAVLLKILEAATKMKHERSSLELVQEKVNKELGEKKYLLVLDDVWIEDRDQCLKLGEFLMGGARGSRILVTTRSQMTAKVIGSGSTHVLQGLSEENSWHLFERLAFEQGQANPDPDLVEIGKQIVKKCANVPLAIRMMGTLLYGKSKTEWQMIQRKELAKIRQNDNDITQVLKLSYYYLDTHLKSCFSYCAVFPKDYVMDKMKLISLWIAQGYLEQLDESQSLINAGEECFSILLGRCFFQDVKADDYGEMVSCKMHDLMHDIAQEVAGNDICNAYSITSNISKQTRHVFAVEQQCAESSFPCTKIRTYLKDSDWRSPSINALLKHWKYLRALDLQNSDIEKLPCAIGRLLHLRYLDLSVNCLESLTEEITKLYNLQTLLLRKCKRLKELPSDLSKLVKLRVLDIEECDEMKYMPCGLDKLTGLRILPLFVVCEVKSSRKKQGVGRLEDIAALDELKGKLIIKIHDNSKAYEKRQDKGEFLKRKEHIKEIKLVWLHDRNDENKGVSDMAVAEELQPNQNLKGLQVSGYRDVEKPSWAMDDKLQTLLPNLVVLDFRYCEGLEDLPMVGRLRFLKQLFICDLLNLEYMEKRSSSSYVGDEASSGTGLGLFPSLEVLYLRNLPKLKGWWRGDGHMDDDDDDGRSHMSISFPHLFSLEINNCPLLTSVPLCPTLAKLELIGFNERIKIMKIKGGGGVEDGDVDTPQPKLCSVYTDDVGYLVKSLPIPAAFQCLSKMVIKYDKKVENLREVEDVFQSCSSSLLELEIGRCKKLKSMSGGLKHLTTLQTLTLRIEDDMTNDDNIRSRLEEEDEIPWSALQHSLHKLDINYMPRGIRHLTSLQTLYLRKISHVKTIPEWFTCLSSLRFLSIWNNSPELKQRCDMLYNGPDGTKINHIPHVYMSGVEMEQCKSTLFPFVKSTFLLQQHKFHY